MHDHVDVNVVLGYGAENLIGHARSVGNARERDFGFIAGAGDAGNKGFLHLRIILKRNQGTAGRFDVNGNIGVSKARENTHGNVVFAGELHAADLQHLGAEARELEHFFKADDVKFAGFGFDARVGGVNTVNVGKNEAFLSLKSHGKGHARCVRAAAAEGGDVACAVSSLEAGDDDNFAGVKFTLDRFAVNGLDTGLGKGAVCVYGNLGAVEAHCVDADAFESHREQADGDLFAGTCNDVELPGIGIGHDFFGKRDEAIGFSAHRRNHHHHLIAGAVPLGNTPCDILDALDASH